LFTRLVGGLYTLSAGVALAATYLTGNPALASGAPEHGPLAVGMLPVSPVHNLVHLVIGLVAILACRSTSGSISVARGLALFMGFTAVVGLLPPGAASATSLGLISTDGIWLHAVTALLAAYVGFAPTPRQPRRISGTAVPA
jgi:hypothetical protein